MSIWVIIRDNLVYDKLHGLPDALEHVSFIWLLVNRLLQFILLLLSDQMHSSKLAQQLILVPLWWPCEWALHNWLPCCLPVHIQYCTSSFPVLFVCVCACSLSLICLSNKLLLIYWRVCVCVWEEGRESGIVLTFCFGIQLIGILTDQNSSYLFSF